MKILQAVHGFPPESRAGTELYTYSLAKELRRRQELHVFHPSTTSRTKEYSVNKCDGGRSNLVEHASSGLLWRLLDMRFLRPSSYHSQSVFLPG